MAEYYVASARSTCPTPAQGCFVEFEDVLVEVAKDDVKKAAKVLA